MVCELYLNKAAVLPYKSMGVCKATWFVFTMVEKATLSNSLGTGSWEAGKSTS